jgi:hypothetical protein
MYGRASVSGWSVDSRRVQRALRPLLLAVVLAAFWVLRTPLPAHAGTLDLHPSGFGPMSFASWRGQQGEIDSSGGSNQALYFQKASTSGTFSAAVAIFRGLKGAPANELTGLQWDVRTDARCNKTRDTVTGQFAGPYWSFALQDSTGHVHPVSISCADGLRHNPMTDPEGNIWCQDTFDVATAITSQTGISASDFSQFTLTGLGIVFRDSPDDTPYANEDSFCVNQAPSGATQWLSFLDNIKITFNGGPHTWTSASDNGNTAYDDTTSTSVTDLGDAASADLSPYMVGTDDSASLTDLVPLPIPTPTVEPTDLLNELLDLASGLFPDVPSVEWQFFEDPLPS